MLAVTQYTDETQPSAVYQALLERGVFALSTCEECGKAHSPPRVLCPHCGSTALAWRRSAGTGTVYSMSTLTPRDREPYAVILVDLDDGPRIMSNIADMPADDVRIGMRVVVRVDTRNGQALPVFVAGGGDAE